MNLAELIEAEALEACVWVYGFDGRLITTRYAWRLFFSFL